MAPEDRCHLNGLAVHKGKVIREKHEGFGNDQFLTTKGLQIEDKVISNWKPRLKALGFTHMRFDGDWSNLERPKPVTL